jgi:hypothetical protein
MDKKDLAIWFDSFLKKRKSSEIKVWGKINISEQ